MRKSVEELIERYQKHLFAAAFSICRNTSDADDVVQDTFLKYHLSKKEFSSDEHLKAWLLRVAINKARDLTRSIWKKNTISMDELMMACADGKEMQIPSKAEDMELLAEVMKLPVKYRIVIHLFYYEDYSVSEIAQILKLSESNVKTRLSRARSMLKEEITEVEVYG
jgi:RNA polymerase sigma-70 factor (ECF subfamily)